MDNENQDVEVEKTNEEVENQDNAGKVEEDKAAKTVEKLQKRLGKLTGDKHDLEEELANTKAELEEYKSGKKTVKKLSEEDKAKKEQDAKDKELASLRAELARTKALSETSDVLKEQGLDVSTDVLNMIVSSDNEKTYANVNALVSFGEQIANQVRSELLTGKTPKRQTKQSAKDDFANALGLKQ
ncbi:capsid assembly scaffolding protein Gp46 family protein [Ligilactobacillus salivarius]|uniref:DUF4355 domain-containing protein n=1 Tax=Ligilactobacillus salivarius TaxID=1624 RepID=A0AAW6PZM8_9LACO|nr:DUF4355 domain-containing protein [Ligilactobacillus salivarius]MDF4185952.1 DUF4355 domain-containing protein [Ligilactobacillus salivarius]